MSSFLRLTIVVSMAVCFSISALAQDDPVFLASRVIPKLRQMIGKPLLDQTVELSNGTGFILENLSPEGARFFGGGNGKDPGESADEMREKHSFVVLLTPCSGVHDLTAKISTLSVWETLDGKDDPRTGLAPAVRTGLGMEQLLALMNSPPGVVTPSTLRTPRARVLHGPVFEYVRGDTTETFSLLNEGEFLRINWTSTNTASCPK